MRTVAVPLSDAVQQDLGRLDPHLRAVARSLIRRVVLEPDIGERHPRGFLRAIGAVRVRFDRADRPEDLLGEHDRARAGGFYERRRWRVVYMTHVVSVRGVPVRIVEIVAVGDGHPDPGTDTVYCVAERRLTARRHIS